MRITSRRRAPLAALLTVALLSVPVACSSSDEPAGPEAPDTTAAPAPGGVPVPAPGVQEQPDFQDLAARARALKEKRKVVAAEYLKTGRRYFEEGRPNDALKAFENALDLDPTNADAQRMRDEAAALLGIPPARNMAEAQEAGSEQEARIHEAAVLAKSYWSKGRQFFADGTYDLATSEFRKALIIMKARPVLDLDFDEDMVRKAIADSRAAADQARKDAEAARVQEIERIQKEREEAERAKLHQRIERLWREAMSSAERERFREVERLCDEILELDYSNEAARDLKEKARVAGHAKAMGDVQDTYREEWQRTLEEVKDLGILRSPDDSPFPDKDVWARISRRGPVRLSRSATQVSEADEAIRQRLEGTNLTLVDWTEKSLDDAVTFLKNNTGVNILLMRAADEAVPEDERVLELRLENINAMAALNLAVTSVKLAWVIEDQVVKITSPEALAKRKVVEFYNVRDLTAKLNSFPGVEINLNPSGVLPGEDEDFDDTEGEDNQAIESEQLQELIRGAVDPAWDEGEGNSIQDKNGTLVIRQTPEVHRKIGALLADLRQSTGIQVRIETRFVSVENNFLQDIGVDFRGLGDDTGGVGLAGKGTDGPIDDFGATGLPSPIGTDNSSGAFYSREVDVRARTQNLFDEALGNPEVLTNSGGFSLQYTYLDDTQLEAILRATQKYERINTVSAPSLTVFNTQRANIEVTRSIAYVKDFDVEIAQAAVIADPIVDVAKEGVVLDVRPIVHSDRRFVTLELRPSVATLRRPFRTFTTTLAVGTAVTFEVPELRKESLKTTVVMPDGGTLLLGGLKFFEEEDQDAGVPILKDIPVIGFLFGRKGKFTNMRDLIILLRVKIIIMEELEPTGAFATGN